MQNGEKSKYSYNSNDELIKILSSISTDYTQISITREKALNDGNLHEDEKKRTNRRGVEGVEKYKILCRKLESHRKKKKKEEERIHDEIVQRKQTPSRRGYVRGEKVR